MKATQVMGCNQAQTNKPQNLELEHQDFNIKDELPLRKTDTLMYGCPMR